MSKTQYTTTPVNAGVLTPPQQTSLSGDLQKEGRKLMEAANREIFEMVNQKIAVLEERNESIRESYRKKEKEIQEKKQKLTEANLVWQRDIDRTYKSGVSDEDVRHLCEKELPYSFEGYLQNSSATVLNCLEAANQSQNEAIKKEDMIERLCFLAAKNRERLSEREKFSKSFLLRLILLITVPLGVPFGFMVLADQSNTPPYIRGIGVGIFLLSFFALMGIPIIGNIMYSNCKKKFYNLAVNVYANIEKAKELRNVELQKEFEKLDVELALTEKQVQEALVDIHEVISDDSHIQDMEDERNQILQTYTQSTGFSALPWNNEQWEQWTPATGLQHVVPEAALGRFHGYDAFYAFYVHLEIPAIFSFSEQGCIILEAPTTEARKATNGAVRSLLLRLLAVTPPGKLRMTLIDPVELGANVAAFTHLGDHEPLLINGRIWSEPKHIEEKLLEISEHMQNVIQKYLRNDYPTIHEYNKKAGEIAEAFRFLVIFDFPSNFTENSFKRLVSIIRNGAKCGVYVILVKDPKKELPYGCNYSEFTNCESFSTLLVSDEGNSAFTDGEDKEAEEDEAVYKNSTLEGEGDLYDYWRLSCDSPPSDALASKIINEVGKRAKAGMVVTVPFEKLLQRSQLEPEAWWTASSAECLEVPLGPTGAQKLQPLCLGRAAHHALIVGNTGSGKSNLMHVIIMALALKYSPDEVQLYLIDFKEGVEFQPYATAKLPHALAIAVQSEPEFGLSVLQRLNDELKKRGDEFRRMGVSNLIEYRRKCPEKKMPRVLLLIDEFHKLLASGDNVSRTCASILENIARQGRAFGMHILLGTQTLGNTGLTRETSAQMGVRIALRCDEADSRLILSDDNLAARTLTRPGEAIYNEQNGQLKGNSLTQIAYLDAKQHDQWLEKINKLANGKVPTEQFIFQGQENIRLDESRPLFELSRAAAWPTSRKGCELFLGEPISIAPSVAAVLKRQSGANFLAVTREEVDGVGMMIASVVSLLLTLPPEKIQINILDFSTPDEPAEKYAALLTELFPDSVAVCRRQKNVPQILDGVAAVVNERSQDNASSPTVINVLVLIGLHKIRSLQDGFSSDDQDFDAVKSLRTILKEGPDVCVHTLAWSDTWANAQNHLDGNLGTEFGLRVAGVMTENDSSRFLDDAGAAKLTANRCLFYDDNQPGKLMKFRPYVLPPLEWLHEVQKALSSRQQ